MKVKSESEVAQLCPTLSNLMDCSLLGFSVHGIFQARVLQWGATAFFEVIYRIVKLINSVLSPEKPKALRKLADTSQGSG